MFAPNGKVWVPPVGGIAIAPKDPCDHGHIGANDTTMQWPTSNGAVLVLLLWITPWIEEKRIINSPRLTKNDSKNSYHF